MHCVRKKWGFFCIYGASEETLIEKEDLNQRERSRDYLTKLRSWIYYYDHNSKINCFFLNNLGRI